MSDIKCTVSNCVYYKDLKCHADIIEVNTMDGGMESNTSEDTCCETFRPAREGK